jgi:hypothetical protein
MKNFKEYQNLRDYLLCNTDTDKEALDALQDGELLGKLGVSQDTVEDLFFDIQAHMHLRHKELAHLYARLSECELYLSNAEVDLSEARHVGGNRYKEKEAVRKYRTEYEKLRNEIDQLLPQRF